MSGSANWARNLRHAGIRSAGSRRFGPSRAKRARPLGRAQPAGDVGTELLGHLRGVTNHGSCPTGTARRHSGEARIAAPPRAGQLLLR